MVCNGDNMKITRSELRKLIAEAAMVSDDPLIMQVTSMGSYYDLVELAQENRQPEFQEALLKAVRERNIDGLNQIARFGIGFMPVDRPGQASYYKTTPMDTQRAFEDIVTRFSRFLGYRFYRTNPPFAPNFNPVATLFRKVCKEAAKLVQDAIDNPEKYAPPERSFFQKAGSFLTGKGYRE